MEIGCFVAIGDLLEEIERYINEPGARVWSDLAIRWASRKTRFSKRSECQGFKNN
jgi:hypothetical protein